MSSYLGWQRADPRQPLCEVLRAGLEHYEAKLGKSATLVKANEAEAVGIEALEIEGLRVEGVRHVRPGCFWIGQRDDKPFAVPQTQPVDLPWQRILALCNEEGADRVHSDLATALAVCEAVGLAEAGERIREYMARVEAL